LSDGVGEATEGVGEATEGVGEATEGVGTGTFEVDFAPRRFEKIIPIAPHVSKRPTPNPTFLAFIATFYLRRGESQP
jgi:X-X-X-Leu-X-X-Gly heptad repeat protein